MDSAAERDIGAKEECDSDSDDSIDNIFPDMTILLTGNSAAVEFGNENLLLGEKQLNTENADTSSIAPLQKEISEYCVSVINMIDLHETEHVDHHIGQILTKNEILAFIFVVRLGQLTDSDKMGLEWLQKVFGDEVLQFVIILFTYETEEETDTIVDDLKKNPVLEKILEKCGRRYQTCNKKMKDQSEMRDLMKKIEDLYEENKYQNYTGEMFNTAARKRKELETRDSPCQIGQTSEIDPNAKCNFILLGTKQAGKSASGNTILGREAFESKKSFKSVTRDVAVESGAVCGFPVTVYDTPGLSDRETSEEEIQQMISDKVLHECESGPCVFLLVISTYRFTEEDKKSVEKIEKILGEKHLEKTWIIFTRGDDLEEGNMTIQEFIDGTELKTLIEKYEQRYHVFNNRKRGSSDQARLLLADVLQSFSAVGNLTRLTPDSSEKPPGDPDTPDISLSSMRIVLLGKTGFGKSASGNTILEQREFISDIGAKSVTNVCSVKHATVSGRSVSVVDTPGYFDTKMEVMQLMKEIARSVYLSSPGPHAFLILLKVIDRFTEHEQQIPKQIELLFGQGVLKYSIILFTYGDQLRGKTVEKLIKGDSRLRDLVQKCGGRYHVFNNRDMSNRDQVNELLQKIDSVVEQHGGGHYSNEMFEDAHRFRQEEEDRRQREEEEKKLLEAKQRQEENEQIREEGVRGKMEAKHKSKLERLEAERKLEEKIRKEKESDTEKSKLVKIPRETPEFDQFFKKHSSRWYLAVFALVVDTVVGDVAGAIIGGGVGAAVGGAVGLFGGPAGVVAGAAAGAEFGVEVGAVVGTAVGTVVGLLRLIRR